LNWNIEIAIKLNLKLSNVLCLKCSVFTAINWMKALRKVKNKTKSWISKIKISKICFSYCDSTNLWFHDWIGRSFATEWILNKCNSKIFANIKNAFQTKRRYFRLHKCSMKRTKKKGLRATKCTQMHSSKHKCKRTHILNHHIFQGTHRNAHKCKGTHRNAKEQTQEHTNAKKYYIERW